VSRVVGLRMRPSRSSNDPARESTAVVSLWTALGCPGRRVDGQRARWGVIEIRETGAAIARPRLVCLLAALLHHMRVRGRLAFPDTSIVGSGRVVVLLGVDHLPRRASSRSLVHLRVLYCPISTFERTGKT
jgi:hypothetical protein